MYTINYKNGVKLNITKKVGNTLIIFTERSPEHKQYLIDVENGVEVIDNPPSADDTALNEARRELTKTDSIVLRARIIEDIFDVLTDEQKGLIPNAKDAIMDKKSKRAIYLGLLG